MSMTGTVYINATGTIGGNGSGSNAANPIDCHTQALYDAFIQTQANQGSNTPTTSIVIMYSAGMFQTHGWDYNNTATWAHSGQTHQGAGIDVTFLQLVNCNQRTADGGIFDGYGAPHNFYVFDMTLDCNPAGNPKSGDCFDSSNSPAGFTTGFLTVVDRGTWLVGTAYSPLDRVTGSNGAYYICFAATTGVDPVTESPRLKWGLDGRGALTCFGLHTAVNVTIQRVKMIHWGTFLTGVECFVCVAGQNQAGGSGQLTNLLIDSCIFTSPASGNKDGCTVVGAGDTSGVAGNFTCDPTVMISNCQFINCYSATPGQPGDFLYQQCIGMTPFITGCTATNCGTFFSAEFGAFLMRQVNAIQISNNVCNGVITAINILADSPAAAFPNLNIWNNTFIQSDVAGNASITIARPSSSAPATVGNMSIVGNVWRASVSNPGGILATRAVMTMSGNAQQFTIASMQIANNLIINYLPSKTWQIDPLIVLSSNVVSGQLGSGDRSVYIAQSPIASTTAGSITTKTVTLATTVTGNTLIVAVNNSASVAFTTVSTVTANTGTSVFTRVISQGEGTRNSEIWFSPNIVSGTTPVITVTFSGTTVNCEVQAYEVYGLDPAGYTEGITFSWQTSGSSAVSSGPLAGNPGDFFVAASYGGTTPSVVTPLWNSNTSAINALIQCYIPNVSGNVSASATYANTDYTMVMTGFRPASGIKYPQLLDSGVGQGTPGSSLSTGGAGLQSHVYSHSDMSKAIALLEQNTVTNDSFLIQEHFDTSTVAATLVTAIPQGAFDVIPTFTGTGCTIVRAASVAGHKGIWTLTTGTIASQKPEVSQLPTLKDIQTGFFGRLAFRAVVLTPATLPSGNSTARAVWRIGLTDTLGSLAPVNCIEWVFDPNVNAFWSLVLTNGSTATTTASAITVAINTWYDLELYVDASGVQARAAIYSTAPSPSFTLPTLLAGGPFTVHQPATSTNMAWHVLAMNGASGTTSFALGLDLVEVVGQPTSVGMCSNWRGSGMLKGF